MAAKEAEKSEKSQKRDIEMNWRAPVDKPRCKFMGLAGNTSIASISNTEYLRIDIWVKTPWIISDCLPFRILKALRAPIEILLVLSCSLYQIPSVFGEYLDILQGEILFTKYPQLHYEHDTK